MTKSKTLFLHVGFHKTASSSIQLEFFEKRSTLEAFGYYYPSSWRFNHNFLFGMFCDEPERFYENIFESRTKTDIDIYYSQLKSSYLAELEHTSCSNLVLSAEDLSVLDASGVRRLKEFFCEEVGVEKIKIIICVRGVLSFAASNIQQAIKTGFNFSVDQYNNIYKSRMDKFVKLFGKENVLVYKFEDSIRNEIGPVGNFLECIGATGALIEQFNGVRINESYSQSAIDAMQFINNAIPISNGVSIQDGRVVGDTELFSEIKGKPYDLPVSLKNKIRVLADSDTKWLKTRFDIDYTKELEVEDESVYESKEMLITSEFLDFVVNRYSEFTPIIKKLIILYLVECCKLIPDEDDCLAIANSLSLLIACFKEELVNLNFHGLENVISNSSLVFPADIFRDLGHEFERRKNFELAYSFMSLAKQLRPEGPVITADLARYSTIVSES